MEAHFISILRSAQYSWKDGGGLSWGDGGGEPDPDEPDDTPDPGGDPDDEPGGGGTTF